MAVGIYGSKKLADVTSEDVDILYAYSATREELGDVQLKPLYGNITDNEFRKMFGADGAYKMRLPSSTFNKIGYYTLLIKPKSFEVEIQDCSYVVTSNQNEIEISKKGIVIPKLQFQGPASIVGYQIEYFDVNDVKVKNFHRIVTSSDLVKVNPSSTLSVAGSTTYYLDPAGTSMFLTLTPDEVSLISDLQVPNLGEAGQKILVTNTFFDPIMMEVEMVDQTIKTLSYGLYGNSTRDLETGIYSITDGNGNLYKQYNLYTRKKQFTNGKIDIKEERTQINYDQNFLDLSQA